MDSQIKKFYKAQNIFITGVTGFLGKVLLEKLLRSTDIENVYVLIRRKKHDNIGKRLEALFNSEIFEKLKKENPKQLHKVIPIEGDCKLPQLDISEENLERLRNVNVIFHAAATTNFLALLSTAYAVNVQSTRELLKMARGMTELKAFIYVSTAYSHCYNTEIDEIFYDIPWRQKSVEKFLNMMEKKEMDHDPLRYIFPWPNTYCFTKALSEEIIKSEFKDLPVGIFRPSIVISTYEEPIPGWLDNLNGPAGGNIAALTGLLRVSKCKESCKIDTVPVDYCASCLLVCAWNVAVNIENATPIYNFVTSPENPITWHESRLLVHMNYLINPTYSYIMLPGFKFTDSELIYYISTVLFHTLPAILLDVFGLFLAQKPRYLKIYTKLHKYIENTCYFATREWTFKNDNVIKLWHRMNSADQSEFHFSMTSVQWLAFYRTYYRGLRHYMLKEKTDVPNCGQRKKLIHEILLQVLAAAFYVMLGFLSYQIWFSQ